MHISQVYAYSTGLLALDPEALSMSTTLARTRATAARTVHLLAVTAPSIGGRGGQFLMLTLLATFVTPAQYGHFVVLQSLVVGTASILGSTSAVTVNAATSRVPGAQDIPVLVMVPVMLRGRLRVLTIGAICASVIVPAGVVLVTGVWPTATELVGLAALGLGSGALPVGDAVVAVVAGSGRYFGASVVDATRALVGATASFSGVVLFGPIGGGFGLILADLALLAVIAAAAVAAGRWGPPVDISVAPPREGMVAGIIANITGQASAWILLFGIQLVGGPGALGVYGLANRFASVVTLAPVYFGKTVIGQLREDAPADRRWSSKGFLIMLAGVSVVAAVLAFTVLVLGFPNLIHAYTGLLPVTVTMLAATVLRALLIGIGYICVARRRWRTWVVADLVSLIVTAAGVGIVWGTGGGLIGMVLVFAFGNAAGVTVRLIGGRRRPVNFACTGMPR